LAHDFISSRKILKEKYFTRLIFWVKFNVKWYLRAKSFELKAIQNLIKIDDSLHDDGIFLRFHGPDSLLQ
jgi:hypothetical protein